MCILLPFCCLLQQEIRRSLITGTAATSLMGTFLMGAVANMPLAVAPGMGECQGGVHAGGGGPLMGKPGGAGWVGGVR